MKTFDGADAATPLDGGRWYVRGRLMPPRPLHHALAGHGRRARGLGATNPANQNTVLATGPGTNGKTVAITMAALNAGAVPWSAIDAHITPGYSDPDQGSSGGGMDSSQVSDPQAGQDAPSIDIPGFAVVAWQPVQGGLLGETYPTPSKGIVIAVDGKHFYFLNKVGNNAKLSQLQVDSSNALGDTLSAIAWLGIIVVTGAVAAQAAGAVGASTGAGEGLPASAVTDAQLGGASAGDAITTSSTLDTLPGELPAPLDDLPVAEGLPANAVTDAQMGGAAAGDSVPAAAGTDASTLTTAGAASTLGTAGSAVSAGSAIAKALDGGTNPGATNPYGIPGAGGAQVISAGQQAIPYDDGGDSTLGIGAIVLAVGAIGIALSMVSRSAKYKNRTGASAARRPAAPRPAAAPKPRVNYAMPMQPTRRAPAKGKK